MEYNNLGHTDLRVSLLGFGTMRLPLNLNSGDLSKAVGLIHHGTEQGINYFDVGTFYCHHRCEEAFGKALENMKQPLVLSGKNSSHLSRVETWTGQLDNTLRHFKCPALDIYFIHYLDLDIWNEVFIQGQLLDEVLSAKKSGKIRHLGFSSHDTPENIKELIDSGHFESVILSYNLINRKYEKIIQYAYEKGLGVIIMNPLAGGLLTGTFLDLPDFGEQFPGDMAAISLNYVFSNPYVHTVLSGMRSPEEIDNNVATAHDKRYTKAELQKINTLVSETRKKNLAYCTSCGYCMPCPQGLDIPSLIQIFNQNNMIRGQDLFHRDYQTFDVTADCCIQCGICETKCPNEIEIIHIMERLSDTFS